MPSKVWLDSLTPERREEVRATAREQARIRRQNPEVRVKERERQREYEARRKPRDPEKVKEWGRKASAKHYANHADKRRAQRRAYYAENTELERERNRAYKQTDEGREAARRYAAAYRARNPELARVRAWRQRGDRSDAYTWVGILLNDPCCYCGAPMDEVDHIVAVSNGGDGDWLNLTAACRACNRSKKNKRLLFWLANRARN